jgi:hypothetical protein
MIKFLRNIASYFRHRPKLVLSIATGLIFFFLTTVILSTVCPPAVLAVGVGVWSLFGNILPLIATCLLATFVLCAFASKYSPMLPFIVNSFVDEVAELFTPFNQMKELGRNKIPNAQVNNQSEQELATPEPVTYTSLFSPSRDSTCTEEQPLVKPYDDNVSNGSAIPKT